MSSQNPARIPVFYGGKTLDFYNTYGYFCDTLTLSRRTSAGSINQIMRALMTPGIMAVILTWLSIGMTPSPVAATKFAGEFLRIGVGPRALGMGGAFAGVADDVTAGYWNPAGLAFLTGQTAAVMHSEQLSGFAYDYAAYAHPFGVAQRTGFGVSIIRLGLDDIPITRLPDPSKPIDAVLENGQRNRPFIDRFVSDAEYAFLISVARKSTARFAIGGNLKILRKTVGVADAFGLGLDAGVLVSPVGALSIGAQVMNLTTTVLTWSTGRKEYLAPLLKMGVGYVWQIPRLHGQVLVAADVDILFEGRKETAPGAVGPASGSTHIGLEYRLQRVIALRVGAESSELTAGAGVRTPAVTVLGQTLTPGVDYAFVSHSGFGAIHRIGATVEF